MALQTERIGQQRVYSDTTAPGVPLDGTSGLISGDGGKLAADAAANISRSNLDDLANQGRDVVQELNDLAAANAGQVKWQNEWVAGTTYEAGDMARDGQWLMVANKQTDARPAPQPVGDPFWGSGLGDVPPWQNDSNTAASVITGQRYTAQTGGWVYGGRVWIPNLDPSYTYSAWTVIDPLGVPIINQLTVIFNQVGWNTFTLPATIVLPGQTFDLLLVAESAATPTTFTGSWQFKNENGNPSSGEANFQNNQSEIRFHYTDKNSDNWETELDALNPGDTISFASRVYTILGESGSGGTWRGFDVSPTGRPSEAEYDVKFDSAVATPIPSVRIVNHYQGNPAVLGLFSTTGYEGIIHDDDAFGVDLAVQAGDVSTDWDLAATSADLGNIGGADNVPASLVIQTTKTPAETYDPTDPSWPIGPWQESIDEQSADLSKRLTDIQSVIDELQSRGGGKAELPEGLYQVNGRIVAKDGVAITGAGVSKTWIRNKNAGGTVQSPQYVFAPYRLEEWMAESPRARFQKNTTGIERPQWDTELSHMTLYGGDAINSRPARWEDARDITHHGIALAEGSQFINNVRLWDLAGNGLILMGGQSTRDGAPPPVEATEMWLHRVFIRQCLGGLHIESGVDFHLDHIVVAACRDFGISIAANAATVHQAHVYGVNTGLLLDSAGGPEGAGRTHFTGKTELENCYEWGLRNVDKGGTSFDYLLMYRNITAGDYSTKTFQAGIDLQAWIHVNRLVYDIDQAAAYAIQNRSAGGTTIDNAKINMNVAGSLGVHHVGDTCKYDLDFSGPDNAANIGMEFVSGQRNEVICRSFHSAGTMLNIHDSAPGTRNNYFRTYGGVVNVWTDQSTFEAAGNRLDSFGSTVNWSATIPAPQAVKTP